MKIAPHLDYARVFNLSFKTDKDNYAICLPNNLDRATELLDKFRKQIQTDIQEFICLLENDKKVPENSILCIMLNGYSSTTKDFYREEIRTYWKIILTAFTSEILCKSLGQDLPEFQEGLLNKNKLLTKNVFSQKSKNRHLILNALIQYEAQQLPTSLMDFLMIFQYEKSKFFTYPLDNMPQLLHFKKLLLAEPSDTSNMALLEVIRFYFYSFIKKYIKRIFLIQGEMLSPSIGTFLTRQKK